MQREAQAGYDLPPYQVVDLQLLSKIGMLFTADQRGASLRALPSAHGSGVDLRELSTSGPIPSAVTR
jgi:hypothetical protein